MRLILVADVTLNCRAFSAVYVVSRLTVDGSIELVVAVVNAR